jgi:aspartyl-tRNA synthetase
MDSHDFLVDPLFFIFLYKYFDRIGRFYALAQSPQQYKQMLMVAGVGRYYQVARCYRDESGRKDRQPEFTQLDLEMSFATAEDVQATVERALGSAIAAATAARRNPSLPPAVDPGPTLPFRRLTYTEAIRRFGVDKPDVRYGLEIQDVTGALNGTPWSDRFGSAPAAADTQPSPSTSPTLSKSSSPLPPPQCMIAIAVPPDSAAAGVVGSNAKVKALREALVAASGGAGGNPGAWDCVRWDAKAEVFRGGRGALIGEPGSAAVRALVESLGAVDGTAVFLAAGPDPTHPASPRLCALPSDPHCVLGRLRGKLAEMVGVDALLGDAAAACGLKSVAQDSSSSCGGGGSPQPLWIVDFPMFEPADVTDVAGAGALASMHHPFVSPHPDDAHLLFDSPLRVRGQCYDVVLNGNEVGGGSVRIHDAALQRAVLTDILEVDAAKFRHLLDALSHGAPPHAGLALGIDRITQIVCGDDARSLRDVIAFPKSTAGNDLLTGAPSEIDADTLRANVGLQVVARKQ